MAAEDLGCNIVRGANSGISHYSSRLSPVIDCAAVANGEVDLVKIHRISVSWPARFSLQELLIIGVVVKLVEASRQTKIGKFDMTTAVQQNVVRFYITKMVSKFWALGGFGHVVETAPTTFA